MKKSSIGRGAAVITLAAGGLLGLANPASAALVQGHYDVEAEVTCAAGTNTVTAISTVVHTEIGDPYVPGTDSIDLGGVLSLSASNNEIGLAAEYVGCTGTPAVTFRLASASGPRTAVASGPAGVAYRSQGSTVSNPGPLSVTGHTDFADITYNAAGTYDWRFRASAGSVTSSTSPVLRVVAG